MKYIFTLSFILTYIFFGVELGYTDTSEWYTHITYMFQHSTLIHLCVNLFSFIAMWLALQRCMKQRLILPVFAIAVVASFLPYTSFSTPTVGVSGAVYAMMGMLMPFIYKNKNFYIYILSILIVLVVSFINPNINFFIHLYCLVLGIAYGYLKKLFS